MENRIKFWVLLMTLLMPTVIGHADEWNLIHFSKSRDELHDCLEKETDLPQVLHELANEDFGELLVTYHLSYSVYELTVPVENVGGLAERSVNILTSRELKLDDSQRKRVKEAIISALNNCSDPGRPKESLSDQYDLPHFVQEVPELAEFLNLMLILRECYFKDKYPLAILYDLAVRAFALLENALERFNNDLHQLNNEFLTMWNRRARLFFDGNESIHDYISHTYDFNDSTPVTFCSPSSFNQRRCVHFNDRNQCIVFGEDGPGKFYKRRKRDFFRILFLSLELMEKDLLESRDSLTIGDIPSNLREITSRGPDFYKVYIKDRLRMELSYDLANESGVYQTLVQSLRDGDDDMKELSLLMMFWRRISGKFVLTTTSTTTFSSSDLSSTLGYGESKKGKGQVTRLPSGKYKPKNQQGSSGDEGPSSPKRGAFQNPKDMTNNGYKYTVDSINSQLLLFPKEETKMSLEILQEIFSIL